jgi:hypothetical protein
MTKSSYCYFVHLRNIVVELFGFKNFYLGIDNQSFFDVSVHLGKIVLECGGHVPTSDEPSQKGGHKHGPSPSSGGDRGYPRS